MGVGQGAGLCEFHDCCTIGRWALRKTVLCISCFAYSIILLLLFLPLLSYSTAFISTHEFYFLSISSPSHCWEGEGVSERLRDPSCWQVDVQCLAASCQVKSRQVPYFLATFY